MTKKEIMEIIILSMFLSLKNKNKLVEMVHNMEYWKLYKLDNLILELIKWKKLQDEAILELMNKKKLKTKIAIGLLKKVKEIEDNKRNTFIANLNLDPDLL